MTYDPDDPMAAFEEAVGGVPELDAPRPGVQITWLRDVRPVSVRWLWPGWLAAGKLHILAGAPGTGKTTLALSMAAAVSAGGRWPDGSRAEAGNVLIWSGEDDIEDTLAPRLIAAGADLDRVAIISGVVEDGKRRRFDPAEDMAGLATMAAEIGDVAMILVDSIASATANIDSHRNAETRRALEPLVDLGQQLGGAVLGISHFAKGTAGRDPVERVCGSLAFGALARIVLAAAKREEPAEDGTQRLLTRAKSNIGPDGGGIGYDLRLIHLDGVGDVSAVAWGAPLHGTARELLAAAEPQGQGPGRPDSELQEAKEWLAEELSEGPVPVGDIREDSEAAGIAWRTIERAKSKLKAVSEQPGGIGSKWFWRLPRPPKPKSTNFGGLEETRGNAGVDDHSDPPDRQKANSYGDSGGLAGGPRPETPAEADAAVLLLADLREIFADGRDNATLSEIVETLTAREDRPWGEWRGGRPITSRGVGKILARFHAGSRQLRTTAGRGRGYSRDQLEPLWERYLDDPSNKTVTPCQPPDSVAFSDNQNRDTDAAVTVSDSDNQNRDTDAAVTVSDSDNQNRDTDAAVTVSDSDNQNRDTDAAVTVSDRPKPAENLACHGVTVSHGGRKEKGTL